MPTAPQNRGTTDAKQRLKVEGLRVKQFLGAGTDGLELSTDGRPAVLCGPNGSGKTSALYALEFLRRLLVQSDLVSARSHRFLVMQEWVDGRPLVRADFFHHLSDCSEFEVTIDAPRSAQLDDIATVARIEHAGPSLPISFNIALRNDN